MAAEPVGQLLRLGVVGAAPTDPDTESWFWFMIAGVPMLLVGHLVGWAYRRTGEVPRFVAPYLGVLALSAVLFPVSGLWLFLPLAAMAALGAAASATGTAAHPSPAAGQVTAE